MNINIVTELRVLAGDYSPTKRSFVLCGGGKEVGRRGKLKMRRARFEEVYVMQRKIRMITRIVLYCIIFTRRQDDSREINIMITVCGLPLGFREV